jgi:lipoate-protein ligase A
MNMAIDEAIADAFGRERVPPTLRFYSWSHPSFSIGRFQTLEPEFVALLKTHSIPLVRRITGGGGVFHHQEITFSAVASATDPHFTGGIKGAFYPMVMGIAAGLKSLGVPAEVCLTPPERSPSPNRFCFARTSRYEIVAEGKNLMGSAMRRWKGHFLLQGSLGWARGENDHLFSPPQRAVLSDFLQVSTLPPEQVRNRLLNALSESLHISFGETVMTDEEMNDASRRQTRADTPTLISPVQVRD